MQTAYIIPKSIFPEAVPSNTLFGAICFGLAELGYDVDGLIDSYTDDPPFFVSSAFPVAVKDGKKDHYFPVPATLLLNLNDTSGDFDYNLKKEMKKIRYVHQDIFSGLISGELSSDILRENLANRKIKMKDGMLSPDSLDLKWEMKTAEIPHNYLNRLSTASEVYFHTTGAFYSGGGLFFLMDFRNREWERPVHAALRFLEDRGFGPKISSGHGQFELSCGGLDLPEDAESEYLITLSRFLPSDLSVFGGNVWYELTSVQGRAADGIMKKRVMMLKEGAVFRNTGDSVYGNVARVREKPRTVEFGMALALSYRGVV